MEQECVVSWGDIRRVFLRKKRLYVRIFSYTACIVALGIFLTPLEYETDAVFKYVSQEGEEIDLIRSVLQNSSVSLRESGVKSVLQSRTLIKEVVEDLGMTLQWEEPRLAKIFRRVKDRVYGCFGCNSSFIIPLQFAHTLFSIEEADKIQIVFSDPQQFIVSDRKSRELAKGRVGEKVELETGSFVLERARGVSIGKKYRVRLYPWIDVVKSLRKKLQIRSSKQDKNVLRLSFSHPQRELSARFLNKIMEGYQAYLQRENEELSSVQMAYLSQRQKELMSQYEQSLQEHVNFLASSLQTGGFLNFQQEKQLLEKPNEDYLNKLYDLDLQLSRQEQEEKNAISIEGQLLLAHDNKKREVQLQLQRGENSAGICLEIAGMDVETAQKLAMEYTRQWDELQVNIRQLGKVLEQLYQPDCQVAELAAVLTDKVSQDIIHKSAQIALERQDETKYSPKDVDRLQTELQVHRNFLAQHVSRMLHTYKMRSGLLVEKIASLHKTCTHLLEQEKGLVQKQLDALQDRMQLLPEKWKRESQLLMQRELSVGVVEGLTQFAESKNIYHKLFQVESKPIDAAFVPYKAQSYVFVQSALSGILAVMVVFGWQFLRWLFKGKPITKGSAEVFGISFCGFLTEKFLAFFEQMAPDQKETVRKLASFLCAEPMERGTIACICSPTDSLASNLAQILQVRGLKVLWICCTADKIQEQGKGGLYDFLAEGCPVEVLQGKFDRVHAGGYRGDYVELLAKREFTDFVDKMATSYDIVLLSTQAEVDDVAIVPLKRISGKCIVHARDVFQEQVQAIPSLAVVLFP